MSNDIYIIAEGSGEEKAAPLLVRKLLQERINEFNVPSAHKANGRQNLIKPNGLESYLERLRRVVNCKGVVVLLDADEENRDCPPMLAFDLANRSQKLNLPFPIAVVLAASEYEAWFLWNLHTEIGSQLDTRSLDTGLDPEKKYNAKEWLSKHMPIGRKYEETKHQLEMTRHIDIPHTIKHSRSFRRMAHAVEELLAAIDSGTTHMTPLPKSVEET